MLSRGTVGLSDPLPSPPAVLEDPQLQEMMEIHTMNGMHRISWKLEGVDVAVKREGGRCCTISISMLLIPDVLHVSEPVGGNL